MILRSIRVEGWRCFVAAIQVGPFSDGLNIIHGPNGVGKSSLMLALARGLFDSHNVGGVDIKTLRSWGRELAPKVTIEFEQGDAHFQLHKQFLDSASAKLARMENGRFVPVAESRQADERAREILAGEAAGRGTSDQRHWGLAQILWATQGSLQIHELAAGTRATIQDALGTQIVGSGSENLEKRIADRFGQFFSPTGKLRGGALAPAIVGLESQLTTQKSILAGHKQRLREFDDASRRIEDLRNQAVAARQNELDLEQKLEQNRQQATTFEKLRGQQKQYLTEIAAAKESYQHLNARIESIRSTKKELAITSAQLKQLREDLPPLEKLVTQSQQDIQLADDKVKNLRQRRGETTRARQLAQLAQRHASSQQDFLELEKRLIQLEATQQELQLLRQARTPIVAPDKKSLQKIAKIARQRDDARLKLDAALVSVSMQLESNLEIEIIRGESTGLRKLTENDTIEIKGAPDIAFRIPGIGQIRAAGPVGDFESLRSQWESASSKFESLTTGYGTRDLAQLESLHGQATELDQQIGQLEVRHHDLLAGDNLEKLRTDRTLAINTLEEIHRDHPPWQDASPDPGALSRRADEIEKQIAEEIESAELAADRAHQTHAGLLEKWNGQKLTVAHLEEQATVLENRILEFDNDGLNEERRAEQLTELAIKRDAAVGNQTHIETQIKELGADPATSLAMLVEQQKAFRAQASDAEKNLNTEAGRLEQIIFEAPYSSLVIVEEEIARLEQEIARQQIQIDAVGLLHQTVVQQKNEVLQSLIDPIRLRANIILQRISGSRFEGVQFDEKLLPTGIAPQAHQESVSLNQISGGEQEQVHFAVRMALAEVAFPSGRQLVVLDDVFTYTDASHLARIASILAESAQRFQIVLLTCHPERYRGLPSAEFFDLEKIIQGE